MPGTEVQTSWDKTGGWLCLVFCIRHGYFKFQTNYTILDVMKMMWAGCNNSPNLLSFYYNSVAESYFLWFSGGMYTHISTLIDFHWHLQTEAACASAMPSSGRTFKEEKFMKVFINDSFWASDHTGTMSTWYQCIPSMYISMNYYEKLKRFLFDILISWEVKKKIWSQNCCLADLQQ